MSWINDKVIIITGASEGIGEALAKRLGPGNTVVIAARRIEKLKEVAAHINANGGRAHAVACDVSDQAQCEALVEETIKMFGVIDIVVNNAGISMHAWFEDITDLSTYEKLFRTNVMSMIWITHKALPHLKVRDGLIVGVSSLAGKTGVPARTTYCTSKFAMSGFMEALRIELMDTGVDVCGIFPGVVDTEIRRNGLNAEGQRAGISGLTETGAMTVDECVDEMVQAMEDRKREWVMTSKARLGLRLKPFFPQMIDQMAKNALDENHGGPKS
ncbi:MAG TPA: SDR family oxidoreductase [Limnobacter sp.]|uniref:SDR family oxidoreductase n=1 Tax=Limnobacter sp. TaxID=2003368 RepID=UPI002EDA4F0D